MGLRWDYAGIARGLRWDCAGGTEYAGLGSADVRKALPKPKTQPNCRTVPYSSPAPMLVYIYNHDSTDSNGTLRATTL